MEADVKVKVTFKPSQKVRIVTALRDLSAPWPRSIWTAPRCVMVSSSGATLVELISAGGKGMEYWYWA
jgi:hypothetical protein